MPFRSSFYISYRFLIEMGYEENDPEMIPEIRQELDGFIAGLENIRIKTLLSDCFI